jgi:hypothetical protein
MCGFKNTALIGNSEIKYGNRMTAKKFYKSIPATLLSPNKIVQ